MHVAIMAVLMAQKFVPYFGAFAPGNFRRCTGRCEFFTVQPSKFYR
jgi:hypothetical protein